MQYFKFICVLASFSGFAQNIEEDIQKLEQSHQYPRIIEQLEGQELAYDEEIILINAYRQTGQTSKAINHLLTLHQADTTNIEVAIALGETYYGRSQFKQAYPYFRTATLLDSTNGYYHKLAGRCASKIGTYQVYALYHFQEALEIQPHDRNAAYQLAIAYLAFNEVDVARDLTQSFLKTDSTDIGMMILDTRLAYMDDSPDTVIHNFDYMLYRGDTVASLVRLYGSALYQERRYEEADYWLRLALRIAPTDQVYYYLGMVQFKEAQFDSASFYLKRAIKETESPNLGEYYTNLALSLDNDGMYQEAIGIYNAAYKRTKNPNLLFRMAIVNEELRRVETAKRQYIKFLELTPDQVTNQRMYAEDRLKDLKVSEFMDTDD